MPRLRSFGQNSRNVNHQMMKMHPESKDGRCILFWSLDRCHLHELKKQSACRRPH